MKLKPSDLPKSECRDLLAEIERTGRSTEGSSNYSMCNNYFEILTLVGLCKEIKELKKEIKDLREHLNENIKK